MSSYFLRWFRCGSVVILLRAKGVLFNELLEKNGFHHRNLQLLAVELYKVVNGLSPKIMEEIFQFKENFIIILI